MIPPCEYRYPSCSLCGQDTDYDQTREALICFDCCVGWSGTDVNGYRLDETLPRCSRETRPPYLAGHRYRCVLTEGHESGHIGTQIDRPDSDITHQWSEPAAVES